MSHRSHRSLVPQRLVAGMTRDQACDKLQRRVSWMARRVTGRKGQMGTLTTDDLASHGMEGVLAAFDRFDPTRGTSFETYARVRIQGAMYDALRAQDTLSRHTRRKARQLEQAARDVRAGGGDAGDVARRMGLDMDSYWKVVRNAQAPTVLSLDAPVGDGDPDSAHLLDAIADDRTPPADRSLQRAEAIELLRRAMRSLPERQRECVELYYVKNVPQADIAQKFGVTVSRVSQILTSARLQLRALLAPSVDGEDLD